MEAIDVETWYYNEELAGGKWRHMMTTKGIGGGWNVQWPAGGDHEPMEKAGMGVAVEGQGRPLLSATLRERLGGTVIDLPADAAKAERPMTLRRDGEVSYLVVPNRVPAKSGNTLTPGAGAKAVFTFEAPNADTYNLFARINAPSPDDDSCS